LEDDYPGVVTERAFFAQPLARVNVAFDDEVGVGQSGFQVRAKNLSKISQLGETKTHPSQTGAM
jgi:hypothetical protein